MRISEFRISQKRGIRLAACDDVPRFMVIAGPNGCGKSTLLNELRTVPGNGPILYVGPHRISRRQDVQQRHLLNEPILMLPLLALNEIPGVEGITHIGGQRDPWNYDESGNHLKHSLCQVEHDRREAIAERYSKFGEILKDSIIDPWSPLRELTSNLLPHLSFAEIDTSNRARTRCLWRVHDTDRLIDLDDLSSGEKAIIQMFYPLLEKRIRALVASISGDDIDTEGSEEGEEIEEIEEVCLMIDEPDLHLHPNLQSKVFDYMRVLALEGSTQVIIATHSPTIVERATFEELYLLRPVDMVGAEENQLIQVASDEERMGFLRDVFGETSNLTAMQPVVIIEGSSQSESSKGITDQKFYRALHPAFSRITLIPGGGKSECIKLRESLNEALLSISSHLGAVALLDRDVSAVQPPEGIHFLPVSMIENFLLDPDAIWEALQSIIERTSFASINDIGATLDGILVGLESAEVDRRVVDSLGPTRFQPRRPADEIPGQVEKFAESLAERYSSENINVSKNLALESVANIKSDNRRREHYHGKDVCDQFYRENLASLSMPRNIFLYEVARHASSRSSVKSFFEGFFESLN